MRQRPIISVLLLGLALAACGTKAAAPPANQNQQQPQPQRCKLVDIPVQPFSAGPYGTNRNDIAADFTLQLADDTTFTLSDRWTGCESFVFLPDTLMVSQLDKTSLWTKDLDALLEGSPQNVHYFFVSRSAETQAEANVSQMQQRIDDLLGTMSAGEQTHWRARLHVVAKNTSTYGNWISTVLSSKGVGPGGFAIDPFQRIRGVGNFADVGRFNAELNNQKMWPYESNLAYAAYEARYLNQDAAKTARVLENPATVVKLWDGETLQEFAEKDVTLPSAAEMAGFDTLEVEVVQACPKPDAPELGYLDTDGNPKDNCGAWDYIANLHVTIGDAPVEIARFITSYHRETHWVVDATPALALLRDGGTKHFRWDFAPSWNTQPTATKLALHFLNKAKGMAPSQVTPLWNWFPRHFNASYDDGLDPIQAQIPADAKRVEFFAILTGHGNDLNACAEFCNHQHELTVNGTKFLREHDMAQVPDGCVGELENGMTPNQAGTWWYGRGGWCPGEQVNPWVEDLTDLAPAGTTATLSYRGLFDGAPPTNDQVDDAIGNINLTSFLVIYR